MKELILTEDGRMICDHCGSREGFKLWKYRRGNNTSKWYNKLTCVHCKSYEEKLASSGNIKTQQRYNYATAKITIKGDM